MILGAFIKHLSLVQATPITTNAIITSNIFIVKIIYNIMKEFVAKNMKREETKNSELRIDWLMPGFSPIERLLLLM